MLIINTKSNLIRAALICFLAALISGCQPKDELTFARQQTGRSELYYQHAVETYKKLILQGNDSAMLHFELGRLYYSHGEFNQAIEEFKNTNYPHARKLAAISYYRLGNFTDALEIFNKEESLDPESLYYRGMTCEKLNLFDPALESYEKIRNGRWLAKSRERINIIEKETGKLNLKDISAQTQKILMSAPAADKYPQAGALILSCDEKIEVTSAGTQVSSFHYIIKILNERGKEGFSETAIDYDSTYEKVELEFARTIKPDGSVVDVGSRHIRDVSRYLNFPLYSNARAYIISFPEIVEGAVIEYKLKVFRSQLVNKKDFILGYPAQTSEPVLRANFTLLLPKNQEAHFKILNQRYNDFGAKLEPKIEKTGLNIIYRWDFENIPQIIPESNMPPVAEVNPTILISTFGDWQEIYNWWRGLSEDKILADGAIKEKVRELIKQKGSDETKIRAIYNFCAQKIRYVAVEYGEAGYEPHSASDIFKNKYGDCKDKAILLITMLREAGLKAFPVLIATEDYFNLNEDFPAIFFNHCIAAVAFKEGIVFLDPTAETCPFGDLPGMDQNRRVLLFGEKGYRIEETPLYPASQNIIKQELKIKIDDNEGIKAEKSIYTLGSYDQGQRYWLLYTQPELIEESIKESIQDVSIGAKLNNYAIDNLNDLNKPIVLKYSFWGPEYFVSAGSLRIMPALARVGTSVVAKDERKYDLYFGILETKETDFQFELPQDLKVQYLPGSISETSPWLDCRIEYSQKANTIYFKQRAELKKKRVSVTEYPEFKKFYETLAKKVKQRIVLEKRVK